MSSTEPRLPSSHPDYARQKRYRDLFNISLAEYDLISAHQRGVCAICGRPPKVGGNRLSVDHDHESGLIRGQLCWTCNKLLGYLEAVCKRAAMNPLQTATKLADYLAYPPASQALGEHRFGRTGRVTNKVRKTKSAAKKRATSKKTASRPKRTRR